MLRVIQAGLGRPVQFPVDPNATFQPGMIGQLKVMGNDIVMGVADGTAPLGILDDIKTTAFTNPVVDEIVIIRADPVFDGYTWRSSKDEMQVLRNPDIVPFSFVADVPGLQLNTRNGVLIAPAGTELNFAVDGSATDNAIRTRVRYNYFVKSTPGDDTTIGSNHVTIWFTRGVFETDQFEMGPYAVNAVLFVSKAGLLTSEQTLAEQPGVAITTRPPSAHVQSLEFMWL